MTVVYGVNAFAVTPTERMLLYANMDSAVAHRMIVENRLGGMGEDGIYQTYLVAYGSKELAEEMRARYIHARMAAEDTK